MKKVLSLTLALVLALGLGVTAMADEATGINNNAGTPAQNQAPGYMRVGDKFNVIFPADNFTATASVTSHPTSLPYTFASSVANAFSATLSSNGGVVTAEVTARVEGTYDNLTFTLSYNNNTTIKSQAKDIVVSNAAVKPTTMSKGLDTNYAYANTSSGIASYTSLLVTGGESIYLPITTDMFDLSKTPGPITESALRSARFAIKSSGSSNSKVIDSYAMTTGTYTINGTSMKTAALEIKIAENVANTKDIDFSITFYPTIDGDSYRDYGIELVGTLETQTTEVYEDTTYVDLMDGMVAEAIESTDDVVEADLGNGFAIFTRMYANRKYSGTASMEPDSGDEDIFEDYPDIEAVFNVKQTGFSNSSSTYAKISDYGSDYYVYDGDLEFIGMSGDKLPIGSKYYLSAKELEIDSEEEPGEEPTEDPEDLEPVPDGMGDYTPNENDNPGTGR